jgi:vacuolar-type H+-ATPase subunit E/Vma4
MTTIEELTGTIIADARVQAARIDDEANAEVKRIQEETAKLLAAQREQLYAKAKHAQEELEQRAEAKRRLEAAQKTLLFKQQLIDDVFIAARQSLEHMPSASRGRLVRRLHDSVKRQMSIGSIIAARKDTRYIKGSRAGEWSGGFIAKSKDSRVTIDMRFETLLADIKARKSGEVARILFEADKASKARPKPRKGRRRR